MPVKPLKISLEIKGLKELKRALIALMPAARQATAAALRQCGEDILRESQRVVPVKTGALASTGLVTPPEILATGEIAVTIGYGGPACNYAVPVHENMEPAVHWTRPGSGPKYLENPAKDYAPQIAPKITAAVKKAFGGVAGKP